MELITYANTNHDTEINVFYFAKSKFGPFRRVCLIECVEREVGEPSNLEEKRLRDDKEESRRKELEQSRRLALDSLGDDTELTTIRVSLDQLHVRIPSLLAEKMRFLQSSDQLVVDLTNGTKEMTSVLYASASLLHLKHLFFLAVDRRAFGKKPTEMLEGEHYVIRVVDPIRGGEDIGRAGGFEILYYFEEFGRCVAGLDGEKFKSHLLADHLLPTLERAVDHYFRGRYTEAIHQIGLLAEGLMNDIPEALQKRSNEGLSKKYGRDWSGRIDWLRSNFCEKLRKDLSLDNDGSREMKDDWRWPLRHLAVIDVLFAHLKTLRNFASHPYSDFRGAPEASAALQTMLHVLRALSASGLFA